MSAQSAVTNASERLGVVAELATLINTTFDLDEIFPQAILKIRQVLSFRRASVVLVTHDRSSFYLHTLYDEEAGGLVQQEHTPYPIGRGLTGRVIKTGVATRVDNFVGTSGIRTSEEGRVSALIVPLDVNGEVIGTLNLGADESENYTDEDLELAVLLGRQIETSLHYSKLLATIQQQREALALEHEQVASERSRLEALIEASDSAVLMVSGGRVAHANQAMAELLVLPREVLVGSPMEKVDRILTRSLKNAGDLAPQVAAFARGDGELRDRVEFEFPRRLICARTVTTVVGDAGEVVGHVLMYRDVTREAEAEAAKSEFVSIVSHELRTPLTSIKTSLNLLMKGAAGSLSGKMGGLLEIALRNLERLIRLVDDLLDLSRIESGQMLGTLSSISLAEAMSEAIEAVKDFAADRSVSIECSPPEDELFVKADYDRLQQVIVNLLSNAVKFSPASSVVRIEWKTDHRTAVIAIEDEGPGIPEDQIESIFDKFRQLERASTRVHGGAGLGLAISRTIVEGFDGELWAESELGVGSTFRMRLRLAATATAPEVTATGPSRLLLVEKGPHRREALSEKFEELGWAVIGLAEGAAALERSQTWRPDVIAVGVELEDMHGLEFLQKLRCSPDLIDTPALFVCEGGEAADQAVSYGADAWVDRDPYALVVEAKRLAGSSKRRVVLIVEDDPAVRTGLARGLRRAGYACLESSSGLQGLELARQRRPDVLITDWRVPGKSGMELLTEIRADEGLADVPAIVVTGYADDNDETAIAALNASLIPKPFSPSVIVRAVDQIIGAGKTAG